MKVTDWFAEFWTPREGEEPLTLASFIGAAAALVIVLIAIFTWTLFFWSAT